MRTYEEIVHEAALRKTLGLPRIELTREERRAYCGDADINEKRRAFASERDRLLVETYDAIVARGLKPPADMRRRMRELRRG